MPEIPGRQQRCNHREHEHGSLLPLELRLPAGPLPHLDRNLFDVEAPTYDGARAFMGVRRALETVLAAEVKAHDFFQEALPRVKDPELRVFFQELRDEEVHHQLLVKAELARCPEKNDDSEAYADDPVAQ